MLKIFGLSIMRLILQVKHGCTLLSCYLRTFVIRIDFKMSPVLLTFMYLWHKKVWWTPVINDALFNSMNYLHHWSKYSATQNYSNSYTLFKTDKPTKGNPNKSKQTKNRDSKGKPQKEQNLRTDRLSILLFLAWEFQSNPRSMTQCVGVRNVRRQVCFYIFIMAKLMATADRPSPVGNGATFFGLFDNNSFSDEGFMNWDATISLEVCHLTQRCTHDIL